LFIVIFIIRCHKKRQQKSVEQSVYMCLTVDVDKTAADEINDIITGSRIPKD